MIEIGNKVRSCVLIPVYNSCGKLRELLTHLRSLKDEICLKDVIIVDDGSSDGTAEMLREEFSQTHVLRGTGHLLWTGAMSLGMKYAMDAGYETVFWLNHDCFPDKGSFSFLRRSLEESGAGCVSGWCYISGYPDYPINPGFINFRPVPSDRLKCGDRIVADGVNGNFVAFSHQAISAVGLPDFNRFPHYGDGPYTLRLSRNSWKVMIDPSARAALSYEVERRMKPFWRIAVSDQPILVWLEYFFLSFRSPYHWRYRLNESFYYHGPMGLPAYVKNAIGVVAQIFLAGLWRLFSTRRGRIVKCLNRNCSKWPREKIAAELGLDLDKDISA